MSAVVRMLAGVIVAGSMSAIGSCVQAAEPDATWSLAPGADVIIACDTKAVVVATDSAKASNGAITLTLSVPARGSASGVWRITSAAEQHQAAFATTQRAVCKDGCPLSSSPTGEIQLWAPKPNSLDRLADGEQLLLAVLKPASMTLRASTFRGKDIEALEEGRCRKVTP